ncbi:tRNA pseudouridine synthase A [bioreactor metagenome]|uniref:tRNA pseudouridine synthase A n=1 Tax=bioreactor metagenome TaxID=1076179 RepID=A0A645CBC0_9ZZZZ
MFFCEGFHGFSSNNTSSETIEGKLFDSLLKTCLISDRPLCCLTSSGRTDTGPSGFGQVVSLYVHSKVPLGTPGIYPSLGDEELSKSSSSTLPPSFPTSPTTSGNETESSLPSPSSSSQSRSPSVNSTPTISPPVQPEHPTHEQWVEGTSAMELNFPAMLNGVLPPAIRVLGWCDVPVPFSSRFHSLSRTYRYFFLKGQLDLDKMKVAAAKLIGKHNFHNC